MKVVAIIQARMGATRLPGKMMMDLSGQPVIARVVERVRLARKVNEVWLATTTAPDDDVLADWAKAQGVRVYRGSEQDVLDRYYQTAREVKADVIVRITGDCPLHDYKVIDRVIGEYVGASGVYDYVCNTQPPTYPDGLDTEVFSFAALEKAWQEAKLRSEREHVTAYIWKHSERFRIKNVFNKENLSDQRWTLDTSEDLAMIRLVFEECQRRKGYCGMKEVLEIINCHPEWRAINQQYARNEGYANSLRADRQD